MIDTGSEIIPIEVQSELNLQAKSLKVYRDKYTPRRSIRASMADFKDEGWLLNVPLWAVGEVVNRMRWS